MGIIYLNVFDLNVFDLNIFDLGIWRHLGRVGFPRMLVLADIVDDNGRIGPNWVQQNFSLLELRVVRRSRGLCVHRLIFLHVPFQRRFGRGLLGHVLPSEVLDALADLPDFRIVRGRAAHTLGGGRRALARLLYLRRSI